MAAKKKTKVWVNADGTLNQEHFSRGIAANAGKGTGGFPSGGPKKKKAKSKKK